MLEYTLTFSPHFCVHRPSLRLFETCWSKTTPGQRRHPVKNDTRSKTFQLLQTHETQPKPYEQMSILELEHLDQSSLTGLHWPIYNPKRDNYDVTKYCCYVGRVARQQCGVTRHSAAVTPPMWRHWRVTLPAQSRCTKCKVTLSSKMWLKNVKMIHKIVDCCYSATLDLNLHLVNCLCVDKWLIYLQEKVIF